MSDLAIRRLPVGSAIWLAVAVAVGSPALAKPPKSNPLTRDEAEFLRQSARVFAGCKRDPSPDYCAPYRPLITHIAGPASANETIAAVDTITSRSPADIEAAAMPDINVAANGHVSTPTSTTLPASGGGMDVSFAAQSDTKTASISLDFDLGPGTPVTRGDVTTTTGRTLSIIGQTPVGQDKAYQNLATLDGMTKATSVGFQYNLIRVGMRNRSMIVNDPTYNDRCRRLLAEAVAADPLLKDKTRFFDAPSSCHGGTVHDLVRDDTNIPVAARDRLVAALAELDKLTTPEIKSVWVFGVNGKIGYEEHDYYDGQTLSKGSVTRYPFQLGANGTYLFNGRTSFTLAYAFQRSYEDADEGKTRTLCPPTGNPNLACVTGYIGAPERKFKHLLTADLRYISSKGLLPIPVGIDPTATYDAKSGVYGFQLPIYLILDTKKYLTGGIRYDWTSDKKKSVFGIFVSSAFCIYPGKVSCAPSGDDASKE